MKLKNIIATLVFCTAAVCSAQSDLLDKQQKRLENRQKLQSMISKLKTSPRKVEIIRTEINKAVEANDIETIKKMYREYPDLISNFDKGYSLIALSNNQETIQVLLNLGADIHAFGEGGTSLHRALKSYNFDLAKFLIQKNADINKTASYHDTPLVALLRRMSEETDLKNFKKNTDLYVKLISLMTQHKNFDLEKFNDSIKAYAPGAGAAQAEDLWNLFIYFGILKARNQPLAIKTFEMFKDQDWFRKLHNYQFLKAMYLKVYTPTQNLYLLMNEDGISKDTAKAFLKIDQKNPPKKFTDENLQLIQQVYQLAKTRNLPELGRDIRRYMTTVASSAPDVGSVIASFESPENPLVSPKKQTK